MMPQLTLNIIREIFMDFNPMGWVLLICFIVIIVPVSITKILNDVINNHDRDND